MRYTDYLPDILRPVREYVRLGEAFDPACAEAVLAIRSLSDESFIQSASLEGVERFERMLGLTPGEGDDLEARRIRVAARLGDVPPYSMGWLFKKLAALCGEEGFTVALNEHTLRVGVNTPSPQAVCEDLQKKIPANLSLAMTSIHEEAPPLFAGVSLQTGETVYMTLEV